MQVDLQICKTALSGTRPNAFIKLKSKSFRRHAQIDGSVLTGQSLFIGTVRKTKTKKRWNCCEAGSFLRSAKEITSARLKMLHVAQSLRRISE